jgi:rhodanese-related sulfurtransferase
MAITEIAPTQAYETMRNNLDAVYIDVRTEEEFAQAHPAGAINIPVMFMRPGSPPQLNPDFLLVVERNVPRDKKLIVGCMMGGRSLRACEILEEAGYKDIANVRGGFGGARDVSGRVIAPGWLDEQLPVSNEQGRFAYQALKANAGL